MNFWRYPAMLAVLLLAILVAQPAFAAANMSEVLTGENVKNVTNQTADLEKDMATKYFNYAQTQLAGCRDTCDYDGILKLYDQALGENTTMLKKTDALQYLYQGKSYVLIQQEKYTDAIAAADAGLAFYPNDAMLWNNRGYALEQLGKTQDALTAYDKAVNLDGNYTNAQINRGNVLSRMGRYTEAVSAYAKANETDPFNVAAVDGLEA